MRTLLFASVFVALNVGTVQPASAQYWADAGAPAPMDYAPLCYADTVHDALYIGGYYSWFYDSLGIPYGPFYRYQNNNWSEIGRFNNDGLPFLKTAVVYHDTLIVAGNFTAANDTPVVNIAFYDGEYWHPYGTIGPIGGSGSVSRLRVVDDTLYALGIFSEADGQSCNGLVKWVGGHWEEVGPLMEYLPTPWFWDIVKYQGHLVVGGNFTTADQSIHDLMRLNGNTWEPICDCLQGGFDGVGSLIIYQGDLYVGGTFYYGSGNAGQSLMRWDGSQWSRVGEEGGSLQMYDNSDEYPPHIEAFAVRDSLLFIGGAFYFADHLPVNHIVTWDGHRYCSLGGYPGTWLKSMAFYQDTLFVATGADPSAGDPAPNCVAKFIGTSYQLDCSTTGIEEEAAAVEPLRVVSLEPGRIALLGLTDGRHNVQVYDAQGRLVLDTQVQSDAGRSVSLHVGALNEAVYLVRVDQRLTSRFVPIY